MILCFCHRKSELSLIVKKQQWLSIDWASQNGPSYFSSNEVHYTKETLNKPTCEQFYICHSVILWIAWNSVYMKWDYFIRLWVSWGFCLVSMYLQCLEQQLLQSLNWINSCKRHYQSQTWTARVPALVLTFALYMLPSVGKESMQSSLCEVHVPSPQSVLSVLRFPGQTAPNLFPESGIASSPTPS